MDATAFPAIPPVPDAAAVARWGRAPRAAADVLRVGFVPLTDAAPLLVADALGLFAARGLRVALSAEGGWAALRDKLAFGLLDAAHLLGPMPIAAALGLGGLRRRLDVVAELGRNGNAVVLSHALAGACRAAEGRPLPAAGFAAALHARAARGLAPPTLAVVFAYSSHNYLLREWLAGGGLDPDRDVRLVVVPPGQVADQLAMGAIDGFCAGEPWGSHAVALGAGRIVLTSGDVWPGHPEKVLALAEGAAAREPALATGLAAAVAEAACWLADPVHRADAVALLRDRAFPALPAATVAHALAGRTPIAGGEAHPPTRTLAHPLRFGGGGADPLAGAAGWFDRMRRWGHLPADADRARALAPWAALAAPGTPLASPQPAHPEPGHRVPSAPAAPAAVHPCPSRHPATEDAPA